MVPEGCYIWQLYPDFIVIPDVVSRFLAHTYLWANRGVLDLGSSLNPNYFQAGSTWPTDVVPGDDCLPYDGSKVPDCTQFVDPDHYIPYYHEHSSSEISYFLIIEYDCLSVRL